MSLILGLHLSRKLYLVSDTRVTSTSAGGLRVVRDNLIKLFVINKRICAVAAGHAALAAFILKKFKERTGDAGSLSDLKGLVAGGLDDFVKEYVNSTGRVGEAAGLIIAGFNPGNGKRVSSARLGEVMSAIVRRQPGRMIDQRIDPAITDALHKALTEQGSLQAGDEIMLDIADSRMFSLSIIIDPNDYSIEKNDVPPYEYAIYHPERLFKTVRVPDELISHLEFRAADQEKTLEAMLYEDSIAIVNFVRSEIRDKAFTTAGGHILPVLATDGAGAIFPTGELAVIQNGKVANLGGIKVNAKGEFVYTLGDGVEHSYRMLQELDERAELVLV